MKTRLILPVLLLFISVTFAWSQSKPKDGAVIKMENYDLTVVQGQSVETTIQLIRATRFSKAQLDGLSVQEKEGIEAEIVAIENLPDTYTLRITALSAPIATFPLIIRAEGEMSHKVKQTMFMLKVVESDPLAGGGQ